MSVTWVAGLLASFDLTAPRLMRGFQLYEPEGYVLLQCVLALGTHLKDRNGEPAVEEARSRL